MLDDGSAGQASPWRAAWRDFGPVYAGTGLAGFVFAATGPVAIVLAVAAQGGLDDTRLASWIFTCFFVNGLLTIAASAWLRMPLVFFWTIPGTVLMGPALTHFSHAEVLGACLATGVLMVVLGATRLVGRITRAIPMPIVMAMVAGVFLKFGIDLVVALHEDAWIAVPMTIAFLGLSAWPGAARRAPPLLVALALGVALILASGAAEPGATDGPRFAQPLLIAPEFRLAAMAELVVPLAVTVIAVQNMQGIAVLAAAGHQALADATTLACGVWTVASAFTAGAPTCLAGPTNAIATSAGEAQRHYTAAIFTGVLAVVFGLFAPLFTRLLLAMPAAFIATLAGLAMLRVLQAAFVTSFGGRFSFGALASLLVTVSGVSIGGIGAAFWGLVAGMLVSLVLERDDFAADRVSRPATDARGKTQ